MEIKLINISVNSFWPYGLIGVFFFLSPGKKLEIRHKKIPASWLQFTFWLGTLHVGCFVAMSL